MEQHLRDQGVKLPFVTPTAAELLNEREKLTSLPKITGRIVNVKKLLQDDLK